MRHLEICWQAKGTRQSGKAARGLLRDGGRRWHRGQRTEGAMMGRDDSSEAGMVKGSGAISSPGEKMKATVVATKRARANKKKKEGGNQ